MPTRLDSTVAQQRDFTLLMMSLHCHPQMASLTDDGTC